MRRILKLQTKPKTAFLAAKKRPRMTRLFGAIYFTYENDRFAKTGSGQTHDGKVEKREMRFSFAETLTAGPSDAAANRKPGVI
eukprot:COSAG06_NODE_27047_length_602_cov_1.113320_1_plen_83_part_00